jgi:hypothetical protein
MRISGMKRVSDWIVRKTKKVTSWVMSSPVARDATVSDQSLCLPKSSSAKAASIIAGEIANMARPRVIKFEDGSEIVFRNCSVEVYEKCRLALFGDERGEPVKKPSEPKVLADTKQVALGTYKATDGSSHFVKVAYEPSTGEAQVEEDIKMLDATDASREFKILAIKLKLL